MATLTGYIVRRGFGPIKQCAKAIRCQAKSRGFQTTAVALSDVYPVDKRISARFMEIPQPKDKIQVTYVWIDGTGEYLRNKTRTYDFEPKSAAECSKWSYDGSSTGQAKGHDSDLYLKPASLYPDPFRLGNNKLLLCDTYDRDNNPTDTNHRAKCLTAMESVKEHEPWFGIEQEYTLLDAENYHPYGWPRHGFPLPQGPYYCGVGAGKMFGRDIEESHYRACMYAGLEIGGSNAEVMPSQWEYQIGPVEGIEFADQTWMSRFILHRIAEEYGVIVTFDPKPVEGDWNGAGAHINFDTKAMRAEGGIKVIESMIRKLESKHAEHIRAYDPRGGKDNERRLTGLHETSSIHKFSAGVAHRGASVRIPRLTLDKGRGYLEDRRPSSNCDPYLVAERFVLTCILED